MTKTIFITGASRGFGKLWAAAFLKRGDNVVATARNLSSLDDLVQQYGKAILPIQLDVNDRAADFAAVQQAKAHFGRIDVLINNAGFGLFGALEETTEQQARDQFETNVFGLTWMTQAVLPVMREQGSGHIIQVSSVLGVIGVPFLSLYNASKFAVEGLTESIVHEVSSFGIKVTLVEPNGFSTDWAGPSAVQVQGMPEYEEMKARSQASLPADFVGTPETTTPLLLQLVDSENPPLRLLMGKFGYPLITGNYSARQAEWDQWREASAAAHGY